MKTIEKLECPGTVQLSDAELQNYNGGGFAYDVGFLFRELWIYTSHGGSITGTSAVAVDLAVNYRQR
ncbi:MAG: hypothetical protein ABI477_07340 [Chryseolinea sp.]